MRVLVTDGDARSALAATRSLGRAGHHVTVGERWAPSLAEASRFCAGRLVYPDPAVCEAEFVRSLRIAVGRERIDLVMPMTDVTSTVLARCRDAFEGLCTLALPSTISLLRAADKADTVMTARRLGVPTPQTVIVESPSDLVPDLGFAFPVVLKPRSSKVKTSVGWRAMSVTYPRTPQELRARITECPAEAFPLLIQERVHGVGMGVFFCCEHGRPIAAFAHRRIREKPPTGGVSVLCESIALPEVAREHAARLLQALEWHGVAMVEFKLGLHDGTPLLMEINGRFWGSLQLAVDAGVDFPLILLRLVTGQAQPEMPPYRVGLRSRWLLGDFDSLLLEVFGSRGCIHGRRRARALADFLRFTGRNLRYENPRIGDLGPAIHETAAWLGLLRRRSSRV